MNKIKKTFIISILTLIFSTQTASVLAISNTDSASDANTTVQLAATNMDKKNSTNKKKKNKKTKGQTRAKLTTLRNEQSSTSSTNNTSGSGSSTSTLSIETPTFKGGKGDDCYDFLGLVPWSCDVEITDQDSLKDGVWQIAANIATDITVVAAYLILGFVIYGGYLYIFSAGDSGKVADGKKTLTHAFIGLAIVMLTNVIMSTIRFVLGGKLNGGAMPEDIISNAIDWFIGVAGVVSAIFMVYGGVAYMTSAGDPAKIQKAKHTILYSAIGLIIVALSVAISAFVSTTIRNAARIPQTNQTIISKEVHEINQTI